MKKVRDYEKIWESDSGNVAVFYNKFGCGCKWFIFQNVKHVGDEFTRIRPEFVNAFDTLGEAVTYAKKIHDVLIER